MRQGYMYRWFIGEVISESRISHWGDRDREGRKANNVCINELVPDGDKEDLILS